MYFKFNGQKFLASIVHDTRNYYVSFQFNRELVDEFKTCTEARQWNADNKCWILEKTPRNKFVLDLFQGTSVYDLYDTPVEDKVIEAVQVTHANWWQHQYRMYAHADTHRQCIVAGEMRTGKTRPILQLITDKKIENAVWVAPKPALRGLKLELLKWNFPYNIYLCTYEKFKRIFLPFDDIKYTDPDIKKRIKTLLDSGLMLPKFIVFDECQKLKNPRSGQGQLARIICEWQRQYHESPYAIMLSGTPAPKDPSDWWNLTEVLCPGFLREGSQSLLKNRLGNFEEREGQVGQKYWHLLNWKKTEVADMYDRLSGLVEVYLKKDCLDLPQKTYTEVHLTVEQEYANAVKMVRHGSENAAVLQNRLRQLSDGFIYDYTPDEDTATKQRNPVFFPKCPKDIQLQDDLEEFEDVGRVIIYCGYQATLDKIVKVCIEAGWSVLKVDGRGWHALNTICSVDDCLKAMDNSELLEQGNSPEKLAFCGQSDAAGVGIELSASPVIIYYSNSFSGAARLQSEDRAYSNNMDKVRGLEIRDYIHLPIDKLVKDNLLMKRELQSITMGEILACMSRYIT